jgi:signal transduction histidine kinase
MPALEADSDLLRAKREALAEFAAGAGHEINNPIATIVGYVQQLLPAETDSDRRQALLTIGAQAYRIRDMIGDLMLFARPPRPRPQMLELGAVLHEVAGRFSGDLRDKGCTLVVDAPGEIPVWADPTQLRVVVAALLRNSLEAVTGTHGRIALRAARRRSTAPDACTDSGEAAVIELRDSGPGLSEQDRRHLFDPFYSGRQAGRGLGFGLPKAWRIVTLHGGTIRADSTPTDGTTITVVWPARPQDA